MLDCCKVVWEGLAELGGECRHHGPPSLSVILPCITHWGKEVMFTYVYICRTCTILRKNKINIVCLNNTECLYSRNSRGGVESKVLWSV